ncbi:PoNe immunity protein domain-containing protein [Pseudomonas sp. KK4]|uniref:PoNe immunity protein domain-containing protein n=1 Tax=Pseudomonas sp. KK4 TaxID=1855729 RepID=UPI00097BD4EB|nr:PoNe immunity protein domain-containing protein [Pseudomonas sp. KK4]
MIRDSIAPAEYWEKWTMISEENIAKNLDQIKSPPGNPIYRPQFVLDTCREILRLLLRLYSQGGAISELRSLFPQLLDTWELSNSLADSVCAEHNVRTCRDWVFELSNLNHYTWCFWLVGLALSLKIPDDQWNRLVHLIGEEGKDILLDQIIASRQPGRAIGTFLLHEKPYVRLLKAVNETSEQQAILLQQFVSSWYFELNRRGKQQLWWYHYGDPEIQPLEKGSYFGRWCIEAVAAVEAFKLDDSLCLGLPHYPGDLLRPNGPSTHSIQLEKKGRSWLRFFRV